MPIAHYEIYTRMLDNAYRNGFDNPAINCTSMVTINAALGVFAEMKTDGIIQFSTGAGAFASGINVALHTDHCQPEKVDGFLIPLIEESERRVAATFGNAHGHYKPTKPAPDGAGFFAGEATILLSFYSRIGGYRRPLREEVR